MGAPKQKWTPEEEEALKAGIVKHGHGKWRTILKDPEFSGVLSLRSNVDLKDKWRNMVVATNGLGSRERGRVAPKRSQQAAKHNETESDEDKTDAKPLDTNNALLQKSNTSEYIISRLDILVLKAIASLKEPRGSNRTNIAMYIEDQYDAPPNFNMILSEKLKSLTATGKLIKVNHKYRIAPSAVISEVMMNSGVLVQEEKKRDLSGVLVQEEKKWDLSGVLVQEEMKRDLSGAEKAEIQNVTIFPNDADVVKIRTPTAPETARTAPNAVFSEVMKNSDVPLQEGRQRAPSRSENVTVRILTQSQVEAELEKMRTMTAQEAAAAAARAVAEAEAALEEAEAAAKDAEAAEADADAAQAFAEAAMVTWKNRNTPNLMIYA